ncbi:unnamed protein product [Cuscuta epithymum]|uniref:Retrotransposon Copia-like N-terminal domain-containing protein n=1 Tax=Cuscuta epithymum TaxID=186058 RepID=A0AAV0GIY7_9ASTE|nr:unnamed protein product [Cuscuta epithymum]CAH9147942.1 unnamed protein product [Cuscuta epithymum]
MAITADTQIITITAASHFPIKLTSSNFPVWKCQVHAALIGLGLDGYCDGTIPVPDQFSDAAKTSVNPCYMIWYRQDKTILSALLGSCSDTIQPLISSVSTAKQAWDKLALTFASTSRGRIISLKTTLARTTKGNRSIVDYLTEMQAISDALALAQCPLSEEDLVISILNGLGADYNELTSAIRVRPTALPLAELQSILLEHEQRLHDATTSAASLIPTAHITQVNDRAPVADRRPVHDRRGQPPRHGRGDQPHHNSFRQHASPVCRFCQNPGHHVQQCRKLQRFLRDNRIVIPSGSPTINHTSAASSSTTPSWMFDSGASHHVTNDAALLPSFTEYDGPDEVRLGDGSGHGGATSTRGESS